MITIISYRASDERAYGGDCLTRTDSDFDLHNVDNYDEAIEYLARRISAEIDAPMINILTSSIEDLRSFTCYHPVPGVDSIHIPVGATYDEDKASARQRKIAFSVKEKIIEMNAAAKAEAEARVREGEAKAAKRREEADRLTFLSLKARFEPEG